MVEYNILGTSPWNTDPFLFKELSPFSSLDCNNVLGFPELENNDNSSLCDDITSSCYSTESMPFLATSDSLDGTTSDSPEFDSLNWPVDDLTRSLSIDLPVTTKNFRNNQTECSDPLSPSKSWSRMTSEERLGTVETLTQIISHQMGLREQLEVIRIIDPGAVVSTADTEFVVDLAYLDDAKLHRIREYVKKYTSENPQSIGLFSTTTSGGSHSSSSNSSSSSCCSKPSKKELKEQRIQLKAWKQRQRKEHRQLLKEKKSGLFMNEQILSLTSGVPPEAEEEVDILA